ncbi:MAG: hypothetical protein ACRC1M_00070 [Methanobacteriaceae archaeon]
MGKVIMKKKNLILLVIAILLLIATIFVVVSVFNNNDNSPNGDNGVGDNGNIGNMLGWGTNESSKSSYSHLNPKNPTVIGSNSYGSIIKSGPYGNSDSKTKVAYIIGLHPLENKIHTKFFENFIKKANSNELKYSYYVYEVKVSQGADNYETGRLNGQKLANEFIVPDIKNKDGNDRFGLVVDVHSNEGNWAENQFIFAPKGNGKSKEIATTLANQFSWLAYFSPPNPTSPAYVTIPLIDAGIPAIIYEEYFKNSDSTMENHVNQFISAVDNLSL